MNVHIRPLTAADEPFLWEMLYQALYVPAGQPPFPREIVHEPEISRYVQGWGRPEDAGFVAIDAGQPVGAAWLRLMTGDQCGYGYVDDATPELSAAVLADYRGQGIGGQLIARLLEAEQSRWAAICLSVSADNLARRLYQRLGFEVIAEDHGSLKMVWKMRDFPKARE